MRGADKPTRPPRKGRWRFARAGRALPRSRPIAAPGQPDDVETLRELDRGPARGMVFGLVPAVLVWAGLITLFAKLLK